MKEALSRRQFLNGISTAVGAFGLSPALAFGAEKQTVAGAAGALPNSHLLDPSWPVFSPELYPERFQMTGVAIARDGTVVVLSHGENHSDPQKGFQRKFIKRPAVLVVDPRSGRILRSWGANLFFQPHQISVDGLGNFWVADSGAAPARTPTSPSKRHTSPMVSVDLCMSCGRVKTICAVVFTAPTASVEYAPDSPPTASPSPITKPSSASRC